MSVKRKLAYLLYMMFFRFTPEHYRPYSLFFPYIRKFLVRMFVQEAGKDMYVGYNAVISPHIRIGDRTSLGQNCLIQASVCIGSDVMMGPDIKIYSRNHCHDRLDIPLKEQGKEYRKTVIGDDVWLGANCIILAGVTVGDHSIVGAGAIVTKNVPEFSIVGGNPAKVIKWRKV